jgi:hypothetical protein
MQRKARLLGCAAHSGAKGGRQNKTAAFRRPFIYLSCKSDLFSGLFDHRPQSAGGENVGALGVAKAKHLRQDLVRVLAE